MTLLPELLTVGVEEEFLLLDPDTGENAPMAEKVYAELPDELRHRSRREFRPSMVELVTDVCTGLDDLRDQLLTARRATSATATATGARLVAVGATPVAEPVREPMDDPRFRKIMEHYGPIARDPAVCGCHVHVGVPDRALAVLICTRMRPWLPVIQALAANSPFFLGADTGFASWRSVQLDRWPSLGPWPQLGSVEEYARTVEALIASGAMMDPSMLFWFSRPSAAFPTVEVRVADVCLEAADTVLIAALVRGLVDTVASLPSEPAAIPDVVLEAAHFNAARDGLTGTLLDPRSGRPGPALDLVAELVELITPSLRRHGDLPVVRAELDRLHRTGTGATRQRRLFDGAGIGTALARVGDATIAG